MCKSCGQGCCDSATKCSCGEKPVDWSKPLQTRNGLKARLICSDAKLEDGSVWYVVLIRNGRFEEVRFHLQNGHLLRNRTSEWDIVNVVEKRTCWVNVWRDKGVWGRMPTSVTYNSRQEADAAKGTVSEGWELLKQIEVEYEV